MKKRFVKLTIALLMVCLLFSGCGSKDNVGKADDAVVKEIAAKALEEKYGEERGGIKYRDYADGAVGAQVRQLLVEEMQEIFPDC